MSTCPRFESLSEAWSARERPAHLDACPACAQVWRDLEAMHDAARALPVHAPDLERGEAALIEAALLDQHARRLRDRRRAQVIGGVAAAAAAALVVWLARAPGPSPSEGPRAALAPAATPAPEAPAVAQLAAAPTRRAVVRDAAGAHFVHTVRTSSGAHDEVFQLTEGAVVLDVEPLAAGDRFRVITTDAEVEARGAALEVSAQAGRLSRVAVISGRAALRSARAEAAPLTPGQVWTAPPRTAEQLFAEGWDALRTGELARAETALAALVAEHPGDPLAEDATYWRAIAASRADQKGTARTRLLELLERHPRSPRAAEASAMLGWLELERGARAAARARFTAALEADDDAVRESARAGLEALGR